MLSGIWRSSPELLEGVLQHFAPSGTTVALTYTQAIRIAVLNLLEVWCAERFEGFTQDGKSKTRFGGSPWKNARQQEMQYL